MEDFVPYDIAVKLKEKGFKEQCLAYYTKDSNFYYNTSYGSDVENAFKSFNSRPNHICGKRIDAPTISQVLKWLRESKDIHIELSLFLYRYGFDIMKISIKCKLAWSGTKEFEDYEQAALSAIEYVLDNLI